MLRVLLVVACGASLVVAQSCATGENILINDNYPAVPTGALPVAIIQGLCEGEACGAVLDTTALGGAVKLKTAAVGYFNAVAASGIQAAVDLEVYDGVTFSGPNASVANLGPLLFTFSTATGSSLGVTSSAINVTPDLGSFDIISTSGKLVLVFWMDFNPLGGNCPTGYQTNFCTDSGTGCPAGKNLMYIQGQGWRDAAKATVLGFPLCPAFYAGNWLIRACVEPTGHPAIVTRFGPPPTPGTFQTLQFQSPSDPFSAYVAALALGTSPGIPLPPIGTVPLNYDFALEFLLPDIFEDPFAPTNFCINFIGNLDAAGTAFGTFIVPPAPGITLYFAFVALDGRISNAMPMTIL